MQNITAYNIVHAISELPRNRTYNYINSRTKTHLRIEDVKLPAGPILIRRWIPDKGETYQTGKILSISTEMIWRVANAYVEDTPVNIDRVLGASYNTRSALETLIALTPEFQYCYPGRVMDMDGSSTIEHGHKHTIWTPNEPHRAGELCEKKIENMAVSEIPTRSVVYDEMILPEYMTNDKSIDIDTARRHTQIQVALYIIGAVLGYRTWIASNDHGIIYKDKSIMEYPGIVSSLTDETFLAPFENAPMSARLIDCIWFENGKLMPAVMEVEHTTGITSGLDRMMGLYNNIPAIKTRYVIVAPDEDRQKAIDEINRPQFKALDARYFPYSAVEELFWLCKNRRPKGITDEFLDCYMEKAYQETVVDSIAQF